MIALYLLLGVVIGMLVVSVLIQVLGIERLAVERDAWQRRAEAAEAAAISERIEAAIRPAPPPSARMPMQPTLRARETAPEPFDLPKLAPVLDEETTLDQGDSTLWTGGVR